MSYIEFFGTLLNIWSVWLVGRNRILNWPVGILGTILFAGLFLQIRLYADFFEQLYFLVTGFWGWWAWAQGKRSSEGEKEITRLQGRVRIQWLIIIVIGTFMLGYCMARLHIFLPKIFTEPASFPYLDSFTTVMSFAATILLVRKKVDAWYVWILVDIIGIWLYWVKDIRLVSLLYVVFLILAAKGLFQWLKLSRNKAA